MRNNLVFALPLVFLAIVLCIQTGCQDVSGIRGDLKELIEIAKTNQRDLQDIKSLLAGGKAPTAPEGQGIVLNIGESPFKGDKNAKITLVEFSDFECPFCARHVRDTLPQLDSEYIKTGKVKYVFKDFPLESIHKNAFKAAEAANCAGEQGKYWEMHDKLFENQRALKDEDLLKYANDLTLDTGKFEKCLNDGSYATKIRENISEAQKAGVTGTPSFFLALSEGDGSEVKTVSIIKGAQPYANFKQAIDTVLSSE